MSWTPPRRMALVEPFVRHRKRHIQATRIVVDDFGDGVAHIRRCAFCLVFKPLDLDHFGATGQDESALGYQRVCRDCDRAAQHRRRASDRKHHNQRNRESYRRRMQDPEKRAAARQQEREYRLRRKQEDPERMRALERERQRRYEERIKNDPVRLAERRENARIDRVLRSGRLRDLTEVTEYGPLVPVGPVYRNIVLPAIAARLREAVGAISSHDGNSTLREMPNLDDREELKLATRAAAGLGVAVVGPVAQECGVSDRTINTWIRGGRPTVRASVVDDILCRAGLLWWDIVGPGEEGYVEYVQAFGDESGMAA